MRKITFLFLILASVISASSSAQKISARKSIAVRELDAKAKEAVDNIRFFDETGKKLIIASASVTPTEMGVQILVELQATNGNTTWTYDFRPQDISTITEVEVPSKSPVGQLKIQLKNKLCHKVSVFKKQVDDIFAEDIYFNFLQVDKKNAEQVRAALYKLREIYIAEENEPLQATTTAMKKYKDFWFSGKGTSKTYYLTNAYASGCSLYLFYNLQEINTSGEKKEYYLTIVPLDQIDEVNLDRAKSKPNCILMGAAKKGFSTYQQSGDKYTLTKPVESLPMFLDVTPEGSYDPSGDVMDRFRTLVRNCDGKKLKL
ncbi:MAG: hypothetical protein JWQ27_1166 [Ferruginibacter sp.]|nr:hypothetical protein [Ferruginibacter sp.]